MSSLDWLQSAVFQMAMSETLLEFNDAIDDLYEAMAAAREEFGTDAVNEAYQEALRLYADEIAEFEARELRDDDE